MGIQTSHLENGTKALSDTALLQDNVESCKLLLSSRIQV